MDRQNFRLDNSPIGTWDYSPTGVLRVRGTIARTGYLEYWNQDGKKHYEYVPDDTLFDAEHLDSIGGAPVTLYHPDVSITPENYKQYAVGHVGEKVIAHVGKGLIEVTFFIGDRDAIDSITTGKTSEISMGYFAEVEEDGEKDGVPLYKQKKRITDHIAAVPKARGGELLKFKLNDSSTNICYSNINSSNINIVAQKQVNQWRLLSVTM